MNGIREVERPRTPSWIEPVLVGLILLVVVEAEWLSSVGGQLSSLFLDAGVVFVSVNVYLFSPALPHRRVLLAILLLPLIRILSLTIPSKAVPQLTWYAGIGIPLAAAVVLAIWAAQPPLSWVVGKGLLSLKQFLFGLLGIPLGLIMFRLSQPSPIPVQGNPVLVTMGIVIFILVTAVLEEFIFRYVLLNSLAEVYGGLGVWLAALIYASMFLGSRIQGGIIAPGLIGLAFSFWTSRTKSIWGVVLAHSILNFLVFMVLPLSLHG